MQRGSVLLLVLLGIALGVRLWLVLGEEPQPFDEYVGRAAVVEGTVADDPDRRSNAVRVVVELDTLNTKKFAGTLLAVLPRDTAVQYGDHVVLRGVIEAPEAFETQAGRVFDYPGYLQARGISALMQHATLREVQEGPASLYKTLYALKHTFERALERVMREPAVSLMEGLLLGEKSGLPQALTQAFIIAGLIHIVVLSGYNIGVVADWSLRFLGLFLPRRAALITVGLVIVLFAVMAGGGMATVRACLMGLIAVLARYLNRPALALRALFFAVVGMVLWNPLALFDVGFILSVLATFGLVTLSPFFDTKFKRVPVLRSVGEGVRSTAATTIAVQVYVLPALLYFTGVLSFVSVPINVVVLPFVPLAMLLGFVAGMLALVHPYVALLPALLGEWLLRACIALAEFSAALPLAAVVVPAFPVWVAVLAYVPLTWWAIWNYLQTAPQAQPS